MTSKLPALRPGCTATIRVRIERVGSGIAHVAPINDPESCPDTVEVRVEDLTEVDCPEPPMHSLVSIDGGRRVYHKRDDNWFCEISGDRRDLRWSDIQEGASRMGPLDIIRWGLGDATA